MWSISTASKLTIESAARYFCITRGSACHAIALIRSPAQQQAADRPSRAESQPWSHRQPETPPERQPEQKSIQKEQPEFQDQASTTISLAYPPGSAIQFPPKQYSIVSQLYSFLSTEIPSHLLLENGIGLFQHLFYSISLE